MSSKWLNNPTFGGPVHYNNAIILDNKSQSFHGIILLDSGAGSNNIASNIVNQMDVEKHQFRANERPIVQAGETVAEVKEYCFLRIGVEFKYNQYYFILIKFNIIPVKKGDFHYDKIYVCDNEIFRMRSKKVYPLYYPYFLNEPKNRQSKFNKVLLERRNVFDAQWDNKYLDNSKNLIKLPNEHTNNRSSNSHVNNNEVKLTQQQLNDIDKQLNYQQQQNNSFIISTDHKKGLDEYIIKEISKLPKDLQQFNSNFSSVVLTCRLVR